MWSDRTKIALGEKIFRKKKFADTFLLFICYTCYCPNWKANKQIPFEFQLFEVAPPSEKKLFEKTALQIWQFILLQKFLV